MKQELPSNLENIRRFEGFKNPEDIWDLTTYEDIKNSLEKQNTHIHEEFGEKWLSGEHLEQVKKVRAFCEQATQNFRATFLELLEQYTKEKRVMSPRIMEFLKEKQMDLPHFTIAHGEFAGEILDDFELNYEIGADSILLVFQLPKPLAQYWWKGGTDSWGNAAEDIEGMAIEWGHFYRELMPVIWEMQGLYENEHGLDFQRINKIGEHNPKKFYYVWEMSTWKR